MCFIISFFCKHDFLITLPILLHDMKLFKCHYCGQLLHFENTTCEQCGSRLGFDAEHMDLLTLIPTQNGTFMPTSNKALRYKYCFNAGYETCNWLLPAEQADDYCQACKLNHTIPNLQSPEHVLQWKKLEVAKHRLIYTLLKLKLPIIPKSIDPDNGLAFDFLAEDDATEKVIMGHANGLITINTSEAIEAKRISTQEKLNEPYRTLLGHFRHESGHYYWDRLISDDPETLQRFRTVFGNEEMDYSEALKVHYENGAPDNWQQFFVSAYATSHPWEDWAETWAHYLHIMDTLETAYTYGLGVKPVSSNKTKLLTAEFQNNPFRIKDFQQLVGLWIPLTLAVNSLNRSMGQPDLYPFVIAPAVVSKLTFIHNLVLSKSITDTSYMPKLSMAI